jgi:hypothetical protein
MERWAGERTGEEAFSRQDAQNAQNGNSQLQDRLTADHADNADGDFFATIDHRDHEEELFTAKYAKYAK